MGKIIYLQDRKAGVHCFTPEMGQRKPNTKMEARLSHYGKHYYIDTTEVLTGRGINFIQTYTTDSFVNSNHYKVGWNSYEATRLAFEKLKEKYSISMECLLD